jgi:hypothetical protein
MRRAFLLLFLFATACEGSFVRPEDLGRKVRIEKSYEAREACLKRQAADKTAADEATTLAHSAAVACQAETERLVVATNPDLDSKVTASIRNDTEFRAMKYVLQARSRVIVNAPQSTYVDDARRPASSTAAPADVHSAAAPSTGP